MDSYKASKAWHLAHTVALDIHALGDALPKTDHYNLHKKIRRASAAVPLQIAASVDRTEPQDKLIHYIDAREAAVELQELLLLAREREYIEKAAFQDLAKRTITAYSLLSNLIRSINQSGVTTSE